MAMMDAGNYEVGFVDIDGRPKRTRLFISDEQMAAASSESYRFIIGFEKKGAENVLKMIRFGEGQTFTLDQVR
jgi:hypothetical protein